MTEATIQREIMKFLRTIGCYVYSTSQGYRKDPGGTRMTAGIPDLFVVAYTTQPPSPCPWTWAEVKTPKGKLSPAQEEFRVMCEEAAIPHRVWRDVDDAWRWAVEAGLIEEAA